MSERTKGCIILKKILYLTDLSYKAKGRNYSEEDIYITDELKNKYDVVLSHPKCAVSYEDYADMKGKQYLLELTAEKYPVIPAIDFQYEVSFYFIDDKFEYALYAPDKSKRWILKEYNCTDEDIAFAGR